MLYKYVYDKGVCSVENESSTKKNTDLHLSLNTAPVCRFLHGTSWAEKENSLLHDIKTVTSACIQWWKLFIWIKENINSFSCVPDSSPPWHIWPCFLHSGSSSGIIVKTSDQSCPCTLHPLLNTKRECRHLCISIPCEERNKTPLLFFPSWFLAMQYPKERKFKSPYRLHIRVLWGFNQSSPSPPLLLHILNLLCRTDFICEGLLCANVWNDCCTGLCATHTWASWELYFFSKLLYIYWNSCVM